LQSLLLLLLAHAALRFLRLLRSLRSVRLSSCGVQCCSSCALALVLVPLFSRRQWQPCPGFKGPGFSWRVFGGRLLGERLFGASGGRGLARLEKGQPALHLLEVPCAVSSLYVSAAWQDDARLCLTSRAAGDRVSYLLLWLSCIS
jgi:hypothetical protein